MIEVKVYLSVLKQIVFHLVQKFDGTPVIVFTKEQIVFTVFLKIMKQTELCQIYNQEGNLSLRLYSFQFENNQKNIFLNFFSFEFIQLRPFLLSPDILLRSEQWRQDYSPTVNSPTKKKNGLFQIQDCRTWNNSLHSCTVYKHGTPTQYKHCTLLHLLYNYRTLYVCTNMVLRLSTNIVLYFK